MLRPTSCHAQVGSSTYPPYRLHLHIQRERPHGDVAWTARAVKRMGLEWTMREGARPRRKRPKKHKAGDH